MNDIFVQMKRCTLANLDLHVFCWSKLANSYIYKKQKLNIDNIGHYESRNLTYTQKPEKQHQRLRTTNGSENQQKMEKQLKQETNASTRSKAKSKPPIRRNLRSFGTTQISKDADQIHLCQKTSHTSSANNGLAPSPTHKGSIDAWGIYQRTTSRNGE